MTSSNATQTLTRHVAEHIADSFHHPDRCVLNLDSTYWLKPAIKYYLESADMRLVANTLGSSYREEPIMKHVAKELQRLTAEHGPEWLEEFLLSCRRELIEEAAENAAA